jgi:2-oxoglutarate ferredoxin oxidoreductase subunit delta
MPKIVIDETRCKACYLCVEFCPRKVIDIGEHLSVRGVHPAVAKQLDKCTGCQTCAVMCPDVAIEVYKEVAA